MLGEKDRKDLKLGIVMPVHNCLKYTKQAIASFVVHMTMNGSSLTTLLMMGQRSYLIWG